MDTSTGTSLQTNESIIVCQNSQGSEIQAQILRLTRYLIVFEVYNPYSILQLSEVLQNFKIYFREQLVYSGRAVVSNLVNTGIMLVCEATLDESWLDVDVLQIRKDKESVREQFQEFLSEWQKVQKIESSFKIVVADTQSLLQGLHRWLEQVELSIKSGTGATVKEAEAELFAQLEEVLTPEVKSCLLQFEDVAKNIPPTIAPIHRAYARKQLHPIMLCAPFVFRTFSKPLGYAGDYEMVNMMLRSPFEGSSLFAKVLNYTFLQAPPAAAHRHRIDYLVDMISGETVRNTRNGKMTEIFNLGCGPAKEIQELVSGHDLIDRCRLTLVDFNDQTLEYTGRILDTLKMNHRRSVSINMKKYSVNNILRMALSSRENDFTSEGFSIVYCAGLFDYLSDKICQRLIQFFYQILEPGGLMVFTNVEKSNPIRYWMEYIVEWHLIYRDAEDLKKLVPANMPADSIEVKMDDTGVNIYLELRKPLKKTKA